MATDGIRRVFIGFDPRETDAYAVARYSAKRRMTTPVPVHGLVLSRLRHAGLYTRPMEYRDGPMGTRIMWDPISDAPCSTEFSISRFLIGEIARDGWALFMDSDVLVRGNLTRLFDELDDKFAAYCVKFPEMPTASGVKMDGQVQIPYRRKLWSSVFCLQIRHPANRALTLKMINSVPGRDLHAFSWLEDDLIGELGPEYNYIPGLSSPPRVTPKIIHFSLGLPSLQEYAECEYADLWRDELAAWAA
jgi:hypothetical protein